MIEDNEKDSLATYREWVSNFSEGIFVMLKVYSDETGTHDGAEIIALSGLIDSKGHWDKFRLKWKSILKEFDAPFFHYRKFRPIANQTQGKPYYGWTEEDRKEFVLKLAMLIGQSAVPTGGVNPTKHNEEKGIKNEPIPATIWAFYDSTLKMLDLHWPEYRDRVLFVFDDGSQWKSQVTEIHHKMKAKDPRIGGILFEDDEDPFHFALQAADLSAIHSRNDAKGYLESDDGIFDMGIIDFLVGKNVDPFFRNLPKQRTIKLIDDMLRDEASKRREGFTGRYLPIDHFDFKRYGYKKF